MSQSDDGPTFSTYAITYLQSPVEPMIYVYIFLFSSVYIDVNLDGLRLLFRPALMSYFCR